MQERDETKAPFPPFVLTLEATVFNRKQLEDHLRTLGGAAQIALAGRSNVGKSSLINALGQRRRLAKTSATPGKTRSVNLYRVAPHGFILSDLPGYGYARCGREEQRRWARLIEDFARAAGIPLLPLLTKADKCSQAERSRRRQEWSRLLDGVLPLAVSSRDGLGIDDARRALCALAAREEGDVC